MAKRKATAFNSTQIKNGKIVRMNKNGTIKSILADYEVKHKEVKKNG
jgi:hypothetical protein